MGQIIESLVLKIPVAIPITTPSQGNFHGLGKPQNKTTKVIEPSQVLLIDSWPDDGIGNNIHSQGGQFVMLTVGPLNFTLPFLIGNHLLHLSTMPAEDGAVVVSDHLIKYLLEQGIAGG